MIETELFRYGYLFVFAGTLVEGDATLLTAAFLARRGYFRLSSVLLIATLATVFANQVYFLLARRTGGPWLKSIGPHGPKLQKVVDLSTRRGGPMLVASRFLIGFRTLIPVVCGATGMPPGSFFAWNTAGALIWATAFGGAGYLGGHLLTILFDDARSHERLLAAVLAIGVGGFVLWRTHGSDLLDLWTLRKTARGKHSGPKVT